MARELCSMVLSYFPENIKALFRRALSFMKYDMFLEAHEDLEKALKIEPKNKDILREYFYNVVKNRLAVNSNGKRCLDDACEITLLQKQRITTVKNHCY
ncbi:hypothetical protein RND81_05G114200 [Saponaria officinalis]|uniref:peptidylprolyl isomerase n=1 Tax=Saponaria officinalis TaxID=3572 RepID=A0AAW1KSA7_SAPOF